MNTELTKLIEKAKDFALKGIRSNEAIEINARIIELDKTESGAYTRLAECYEEQGKLQRAVELYKQVIQYNNNKLAVKIAKNFLKSKGEKY